jgi:HPt (histidine-containing phosphotransfer) domain-containing protein
MTDIAPGNNVQDVCNLKYLVTMMNDKKPLILGMMDAFLRQFPEELNSMKDAIAKINYLAIKSVAHTMKSSIGIMGISVLLPILKEMEDMGTAATNIEKIMELDIVLNTIAAQAMQEIKKKKLYYV